MLWGQQIKVYTNHKNLIRDALGLTSDQVYRWRLLLEEYAPEKVYIKGIHNTVADAISRLEYNPEINPTNEQIFANLRIPSKGHHWKGFAALWRSYNEKNPGTHGKDCNLNLCLPIVARRKKSISSPPRRSPTLNGLIQQLIIASRATMSLTRISTSDWLTKLP